MRGDYRFIQEETPEALCRDVMRRLDSFQGGLWYRVGYHACDHDEQNGSSCSWDYVWDGGTVPSDIPEITVA